MSIMNPLPPQAYTKETLVQAYAWLQNQNDNIKELATNPDVLVGLYLKAKLQGDSALERPSIQNFKNELKNLAGMIGEFEVVDNDGTQMSPPQPPPQAPRPASQTFRFRSQDLKTEKVVEQQVHEKPNLNTNSANSSSSSFSASVSFSSTQTQSASEKLDSRSLEMIQEVKNHFNLSSDTEAMRLLIAAGYHQVKGILK